MEGLLFTSVAFCVFLFTQARDFTTPPLGTTPAGCSFEGKHYRVGEQFGVSRREQWCYGYICVGNQQIVAWDGFNCGGTTKHPLTRHYTTVSPRTETLPFDK